MKNISEFINKLANRKWLTYLEFIASAVVIILIVVFFSQGKSIYDLNVGGINDGYLTSDNPTLSNTPSTNTTKPSATTASKDKPNYEKEIADFTGKRIQINNCQASPTSMTVKNNTTILLDGFSEQKQTITVASKTIVLDGYATAKVTLNGSDKVKTSFSVGCLIGDSQHYNIATIITQP